MNYGITYTVNTKSDCLYHVAKQDGAPLCGSKASIEREHIPSPARHCAPVNCSNCRRVLDAAVKRAWRGYQHVRWAATGRSMMDPRFHWTIDGQPACLVGDHMCSSSNRDLIEAFCARYLADHPGADVAIVEAPCKLGVSGARYLADHPGADVAAIEDDDRP